MVNSLNKLIVFYRLALAKKVMDVSEIIEWADHEIMHRDLPYEDDFIFELSLSKGLDQVLNILDLEIFKRGIANEEIDGNMFIEYLRSKENISGERILDLINILLELSHFVHFTEEKSRDIYYMDECRDEYFEGIMSLNEVKEAFYNFIDKKVGKQQ